MERNSVCLLFYTHFSFSFTPESFDHNKLNPVGSAKRNKALMNINSRGSSSGFKKKMIVVGSECFCIGHSFFFAKSNWFGYMLNQSYRWPLFSRKLSKHSHPCGGLAGTSHWEERPSLNWLTSRGKKGNGKGDEMLVNKFSSIFPIYHHYCLDIQA